MTTPGSVTRDRAARVSETDPRQQPLAIEGKRYIAGDHLAAVIQIVLALAAARTIDWYNAWLYVAIVLALKLASALILMRINPSVLNARGTKQEMSKREKIFFSVLMPAALSIPVVAGLDVGGAGWTHRSTMELGIGLVLLIAGIGVVIWALAVNAFFEPTVRLQRGRGHRVCRAGPYRIVRHPGYVGALAATAGVPLVLGSLWCFAPFAIIAFAFVIRTAYEDRMLRDELEGYDEYTTETRFRLVPFVW